MLRKARLVAVAGLLAVTATATAATATAGTEHAGKPLVTLPDMRLKVPVSDISIGNSPSTGRRELQFTHITWTAGAGPFEIDPDYDPATGTASFSQAVYNSPKPGTWNYDHSVPLSVTGVFDPPFDYRFPLTRFTLATLAGKVVATSPKTDYCITADTFVGGVPNTPNRSFIPQGNCASAVKPLGWSVGWGDQYDQTDDGQPIDLTGVPDGSYVLRGVVDPQHVLTEGNQDNNEVDTKLRISGSTVTVLSQANPVVVPPKVKITSPANGTRVGGAITLRATAAASRTKIASVQFLLDGEPLGPPLRSAPYAFAWTVGSTSLGSHRLSARVTDRNGNMGTAPVRTVRVVLGIRGGLEADASVSVHGHGTIRTPAFGTSVPGDVVVAFASSDGPRGAGQQALTIGGAGLKWKLIRRANARSGDAEVWAATAPRKLREVHVTATQRSGGYGQYLTVVAFRGSSGIGAAARASQSSGAPTVKLTATAGGSLSFAVGEDWDNAIARTLGGGQVLVGQWLDTGARDTNWVQGTARASKAAHRPVVIGDTAPAGDEWNLAAVEVKPRPVRHPVAGLMNPVAGQTVSGTVPVAAYTRADVAVRSVQFLLDGRPLGVPVTAAPFAIRWRTTGASPGEHALGAVVTDAYGNSGYAAQVRVTVRNPAPAMTCWVMQAVRTVTGTGEVRTAPFHTAARGELLLAFVSADGAGQRDVVSGAGSRWHLLRRADAGGGDAEVWRATAPAILTRATVVATPARRGLRQRLTVIAMEGTAGTGAVASGSGAGDAPAARLTTRGDTSLIFAVGNAAGRTSRVLPRDWAALGPWADGAFWAQYSNQPVPEAGTSVFVTDGPADAARWNIVAVEVVGDGS